MPTGGYVLLVEDDQEARELLSVLLERNDYRLLTAGDGDEAQTVLRQRGSEIDAIILDIMIPGGLDGYGLCDWLRGQAAPLREIPVIILSAKSSPEEMARSFACGAFQHITKPYDNHYLLAVLDSMLRLKRIQDNARATAEKFAAIFENAPVGILVVNRQYEILEMSRDLREKYPAVEPGSGVKVYELLYTPPRTEPDPDSPVRAALEDGEIRRRTLRLERAGRTEWWDASAAPLMDEEQKVSGGVLILQDVTHEREMEERLRDEVERKRATEEKLRQAVDRHKAVLTQQDRNADRLLEVQRELRRKTKELGETNEKLEAANALLEMLSITDELTGLFNRRRFNEAFTMEVRRATRYHHSLSVIMLDIDHFKEVNDTHGHPAGDIVLKRLGAILRDHLRETDLVARYGGEEFVMVLPETTLEIARTIAERLRARIENETFRTDEKELRITVSMGLVSRQGTLEAEALLAEADEALYRAKSGGRNRVELAATG